MNKFSKTLSVLLSAAMGLSFHASSFKSFGVKGEEISLNNSKAQNNDVLSKEDLNSFKGKIYRTSENTLVNESCIPLSKNGEIIKHNDLTSTPIVKVPESLFVDIPLHPVVAFLNKYDGPKYVEEPGTNDYGYPEVFVFDDLGKFLVFDKSTGNVNFLEDKEGMGGNDVYVYLFPSDLAKLTNIEVHKTEVPLDAYEKIVSDNKVKLFVECNKLIQDLDEKLKLQHEKERPWIKTLVDNSWVIIPLSLIVSYYLTLPYSIDDDDD